MITLCLQTYACILVYVFDRYFDGGVSSVYMWDLDHGGFAACILIKKLGDGSKKIKGCWDAIHVIEVQVFDVHKHLISHWVKC